VAHLTPEQFVEQVLVRKLGVRAVVLGHDFCFGYKQSGNVRVLQELGRKYGFTTEEVRAVTVRGRLVSSTALRQLIEAGRVAQAARLLERPYALEGEVVAAQPGAEYRSAGGHWCLRDAHFRWGWQARVAVGDEHRLPADVRRGTGSFDRDFSAGGAGG
jgi:hypothetical protein